MNKARGRTGHLDFLNRSYSDMAPMGEWDSRPQRAVGGGTWVDSH